MKTDQTLLKLLALSALCAAPQISSAAPLVSVGDTADIYFNGYTSLESTSNVFRDEDDEVDDLVWRLVPGFEVNFGRGASNLDLSLITRYEIRRYAEEDQLDTELFSIRAQGTYRSSRLDLSGHLGFSETKTSTGDSNVNLDDLVESDNVNGALNGEYRFSPKFSFGSGLSYSEREYKSPFDAFFADRETVRIPVDLFYELTPKVDLSGGYSYTNTSVDAINPGTIGFQSVSAYDQKSHFFNVGARGNLLPKLTGFFKVGYRVSDNDDRDVNGNTVTGRDDGMLGLDADFTWAVSPKLSAQLGASRDFGTGGEGQSTENTSVDASLDYSLNSYFSATGFGSYTLRDYDTDREDNQYRLGARLNYTPNEFWSFGGGYTYDENDSNIDGNSYTDHRFDITASLRY
jgi:hypothetical protein